MLKAGNKKDEIRTEFHLYEGPIKIFPDFYIPILNVQTPDHDYYRITNQLVGNCSCCDRSPHLGKKSVFPRN